MDDFTDDFYSTDDSDLGAEVADTDMTGFIPRENLPGDSQGETNGLYAGVTDNRVDTDGMSYFTSNTPGKGTGSIFDQISSAVKGIGSTVRDVKAQSAATKIADAKLNKAVAQANASSIVQQWNALSVFEKAGFALAVVGILYAMKH